MVQVVQCGTGCAMWYKLCSVAQVLINRSVGLVWLWLNSFYLLIGWHDGERKGGRILLQVESKKLGSGNFLQVVACKSGGRSLLPVEAEKLKSL